MSGDALENFIDTYLDFNIGLVCILGIVIFLIYLFLIKCRKSEMNIRTIVFGLTWSIYLMILIAGTLLNRQVGQDYNIKLTPFWSYEAAMEDGAESIIWQIIYNVVMFIPWGIFLAQMWDCMKKPYWNIGSALFASMLIEGLQFIFRCGLVEFDDVFHNVLGGITGYGIWCMYNEVKMKKEA